VAAAERPFVAAPAGPAEQTGPAARLAAERWDLPSPVLLRAGMTAIYAAGDTVLRVAATTAPAEAALELAGVLADAGVRVVQPRRDDVVHVGELSVTAWERLVAADTPVDWRAVGAMVRRVHQLDVEVLPPSYPVPPARTFPWWQFDELLVAVGDELDAAARAGIDAAIAHHGWWVDAPGDVVCHGDVHPANVMATAEGTVLLDWDLLCTAPPAWDHAMLVRIAQWGGDPSWYDEFAAGYGESWRDDPLTVAVAELRLVAATLMRLVAGRRDAAAMGEAQRRLAYWRGDADAETWTAM
jgi:Ser/Thr protein kinase RdoA (MazF antagonist)